MNDRERLDQSIAASFELARKVAEGAELTSDDRNWLMWFLGQTHSELFQLRAAEDQTDTVDLRKLWALVTSSFRSSEAQELANAIATVLPPFPEGGA